MTIDLETMSEWSRALLAASGLEDAGTDAVVDTLAYAERRGLPSHGFIRLPTYASRIRAGGINGRARVRVLSDQAGLVIMDADDAAGAFSAIACVEVALAKARAAGAAVVIACNANHFGAAGYFTDLMARSGFLGIALSNTDAIMCAPFGGRPVLGSNPISVAVPVVDGQGPQLDMATSEGNWGRLLVAREHGELLPPGWAVDAEGVPTDDPAAALGGALLPTGGPKGFGLAFMIDCLAAIGGAQTSDGAGPLYGDPARPQGLGHVFIAVAVDAVQSESEYSTRITSLTAAVHESGLPGSTRPPLTPGEPEKQRLAHAHNWVADDTTLRSLENLSHQLGVPIPIPTPL